MSYVDQDLELAIKLSKEWSNSIPVGTAGSMEENETACSKSAIVDPDYKFALDVFNVNAHAAQSIMGVEDTIESDYELALRLSKAEAEAEAEFQHERHSAELQQLSHWGDFPWENIPQTTAKASTKTGKGNNSSRDKLKCAANNYFNESISVVDPCWETIDPIPDIYALFDAFNKRFFWNKLASVEVKWSPRMTSCAGVCSYASRAGFCSVRLSKPLLTFRPRKDLVETLLHEMIHALLFVTKNDRDRDAHGPRFHSHMYRINKESGANITVYHNFIDEVKHYKTHWWKCNGPCHLKPPYFGLVKRAMNRAPGPNDRWWNDHRATCAGEFVKIKQPENYAARKSTSTSKRGAEVRRNGLENYFDVLPSPTTITKAPVSDVTNIPTWTSSSSHNNSNQGSSGNSFMRGKRIVSLVDLAKGGNGSDRLTSSNDSKQTNLWQAFPGQENILRFINKS